MLYTYILFSLNDIYILCYLHTCYLHKCYRHRCHLRKVIYIYCCCERQRQLRDSVPLMATNREDLYTLWQ